MEENNRSSSICPVCCKTFNVHEIESHVNRCLFLSSTATATSTKKLSFPVSDKRKSDDEICPNAGSKKMREANDDYPMIKTVDSSASEGFSIDDSVPLAERMRPSSLQDYVGHHQVLGENALLRILLERNEIPSMILWGPPGCGKTSLAHVISRQCNTDGKSPWRFVKLSATTSGVNDVKEAVKIAKNELASFKRRTILFMDEIHRFNKLQQDIFLPHVESGCVTLIGATTENPSFSLNSALLSRCRVFVLDKLTESDILGIMRAAADRLGLEVVEPRQPTNARLSVDSESMSWLASVCDGDARIALNSLQMALQSCNGRPPPATITLEDIRDGIKRSHLLYDRKGEEHYNIISALHKSVRASDDSAALYWLARMLEGGEDPVFIARRLVVCASEDVGILDSGALPLAVSAMQACQLIGMPECGLFLAHLTTYLARAPKSREVYNALNAAKQCVRDHRGALPSVPFHLRNAPTKLTRQLALNEAHWALCCVVRELCELCGAQLVFLLVFVYVHLVFDPYFLYLLYLQGGSFDAMAVTGLFGLAYAAQLYTLTTPCSLAVAESRRTATVVARLLVRRTNDRKPLLAFAHQLDHRRVQFDAAGLFTLETPLVVTLVTAGTTYLAIIIQLRGTDQMFSWYGAGYNMREKDSSNLTYMPPGMENVNFFNSTNT